MKHDLQHGPQHGQKDDPEAIAAALRSVRDYIRHAVSRFNDAGLEYGHGTGNAFDEAVFMVLEALHLPIDTLDPWWDARLTMAERRRVLDLIDARVTTRKPASYLLNKAYLQGIPFYVDERVIVPRSFIAEILCDDDCFSPVVDAAAVGSVLDLCTGSGCLAILAAYLFPQAQIDAVDLSHDALEVARRNIADHGFEDRVQLFAGDLFAPLAGRRYDLILSNPPYVDAGEMADLPPEYVHEPAMALAGGDDGLDLVRRILDQAPAHLTAEGGLLCEIGTGRERLEAGRPDLPFLWLDTAESNGEVFWLARADMPEKP
ncbi:MAG: 50S ribosomal protein L3 N(5)-glutamine methyltransferase [Micavibrio aeruginosavorus]|nr:50S ribosomal protein L3 N(5)-glutamine methyltransferase [Micavibrio aeruginosavorus]